MARIPGVGDMLGPYRITRELGAGGMGIVFEAIEEGLGRRVALKVLSLQLASEPEFRTRFVREASVLARSDSPHIIQVYSHGEQDGCLYLATQYVSGGDLAVRVAADGLPTPDVALDIAAQVASALADAHAVGVIHRDVKPHNVLLRPGQGQVHAYLCDFGIARDGDSSLTSSGVVAGTYAYLAPERFRGEVATAASDTYALGCLMWFLLTGRAPYDGGLVQLAHQHEFAPIPQLPGASDQLNGFLLRSMAKDPAARHPSAAAAAADLRAIRAGGRLPAQHFAVPPPTAPPNLSQGSFGSVPPVHATPAMPAPAPAPAEKSRRSPLVAVLAVLAALVLGIGGGVGWHFLRTADGGPEADDQSNQTTGSTRQAPTDDASVKPPGAQRGPVTPADFDGDGSDDTVFVDNVADQTLVLASSSSDTGFGDLEAWADTAYGDAKVVRGDFTGDGFSDLALVEADRVRVARSTGSGFTDPEDWGDVDLPEQFRVTAGDFNGDGRTDLAFLTGDGASPTYISLDVALSDGSGFDDPSPWAEVDGWTYADMKIGAGDVTGDGKADLIEMGRPPDTGGIDIRVLPSLGDSFAANELWFLDATWDWTRTRTMVGDADGDGDADVLIAQDRGSASFSVLTAESGGLTPGAWTDVDVAYDDLASVAADTDGDGISDVVLLDRSTGVVRQLRQDGGGFAESGRTTVAVDGQDTLVIGITR
ncbi:MAG: protein kinase [Propionibacteriales bacterium]|nr:protein kinase [Propionibacteriales bacterium]